MKHDYLTVVSIVGNNDGGLSIPAISKSIAELPGSHGLLISISRPIGLPDNIEWKEIFPLDYRQYSLFVMFSLQHFISTEFCLIVQDDGWVLNGKNWSNDFLSYDYIGAPCHNALIGDELWGTFQWVDIENRIIIQNGGFSLRSKKLLSAPSSHGALYWFSEEKVFQNEDVQLTGIFRDQLAKLGIRFAPDDISKSFSVEDIHPSINGNLNFKNLFGSHNTVRRLLNNNTIIYRSRQDMLSMNRGAEFVNFLESELNYKIIFKDEL
jgi:hypothetical protein